MATEKKENVAAEEGEVKTAKKATAKKETTEKAAPAKKPAAKKAEGEVAEKAAPAKKPAAKKAEGEVAEKAAPAKKPAAKKAEGEVAEKAAPAKKPAAKKAESEVAEKATAKPAKVYSSRVKEKFETEVRPYLFKKFNYDNINQVPKLVKIVINTGLGDIKDNAKSMQIAFDEIKQITGQKPIYTVARKSVANFKVREGMNVGIKVTLREQKMYDFFDKFVSIALPRVRDFKGVDPNSFDGRGNYALGVKEQLIFPEISYDQVEKIRGFDICFVTTAKTDEEARELLKAMGMPFKVKGDK